MGITAKELAHQLGLSPAAVSFALNGRPGVSAETRARVLEAAEALGYDFSNLRGAPRQADAPTVAFVFFNRHQIFRTVFFDQMARGADVELNQSGYHMLSVEVSASRSVPAQIETLTQQSLAGIILLATEMTELDLMPFTALDLPMVLLDTCIPCGLDRVQINNYQGIEMAVERLYARYGTQPGVLTCSNAISNFQNRSDGYHLALQQNGGSAHRFVEHVLPAETEDARVEMLALIDSGAPLARCYVSCFDGIALGAMAAFAERGYRIPEDVGFVGFDNIPESATATPPLTTINVPSGYMGTIAARRLTELFAEEEHHPLTIEVGTSLIPRASA